MTREEFIKLFGECPFKMVMKGHKFTDPEILIISDNNGWTIAHSMAEKGYRFTDPEILKLSNYRGWTVAHMLDCCAYDGPKRPQIH